MASLNVSDVLDDPDFRRDDILLTRRLIEQLADGTAVGQPAAVLIAGVVIPDGGDDQVQTPEGNMVQGDLTLFTRVWLTAGTGNETADLIDVDGDRYQVLTAKPYRFGDGYTQAICKQVSINPTLSAGQGSGGYLG